MRTLEELMTVEDDDRTRAWENEFLVALTNSNVKVLMEEPQTGPDGWPYLLVSTEEGTEPVQKILAWLATRGIGLVVNPYRKDYPDYILSYGMIWHFRETGLFFKNVQPQEVGEAEYDISKIHAGTPSPQYLPDPVRAVLRRFFNDQQVKNPKILLISPDKLNYDLAFSIESLGNPPEEEHAGIAEAVGWFLPPHYSIVLVNEKGLPPFVDL
ncbi:MAG: hypothetical protein AB7O96_05835 [Pseudobdellovibrionaceae bacterium]